MEKVVFISILILQTGQLTSGKPFLINSLSSFLGASGSASSAINPLSENIGAITQTKNTARLTDFDNEFADPDATTTESQPSFIQRKVSKIIQKLVTLSQITAVLQHSTQQNNDTYQYPDISQENLNAPSQTESEQKDTNLELERNIQKQEPNKLNFEWSLDANKAKNANVFEFEWADKESEQLPVYGVPKFNLDQPLKINLKQDSTTTNSNNSNRINSMEDNSNSKEIPTTIGVYVLELFASIIGLAVGATNQINHSLNANNTV